MMKLNGEVLSITRNPSIFAPKCARWTISGERFSFKWTLELSDPEWTALNKALKKPLQPGDTIEIEIPGALPEEDLE